jgi:hypothetical protein
MSNKFLGTTGAEIDVTNGSTVLYGSTIGAKSLKPSYAVKTNSAGNLISTKLFISDVENLQQKLNSVITNPYAGDLESKSFVSNNIYDKTRTSNINLSNDTINIISESVKVNGQTIITAGANLVQNPMTENLNCNTNNLTNIGLLNGYDIGTIDSDLTQVKDKTLNITLPITFDGTTFAGAVYADTLVKSGGTNQQYLMADGTSLQYSANSGNSNFYLYNNGTDQDPTPPNGFITYNAPLQDNATSIYISHRTRDTIDIEVFFKNLSTLNDVYIQDQENSDNNITYNITGNPIIVSQAQVTIPVIKRTSNGTGSSNFGNGHNLLLSFFTNSIETDVRISNLETKTQNIEANASKLTLNRSLELKINDTTDFLAIRSLDGLSNYLIMTDTNTDIYTDVNLNGNDITNVGSVVISGGSSTEFLKADGTLDDNDYLLPTDTVITDLQSKTQNITGSLIGTDITNNFNVILRVANGDFFTIRNDATPFSTNKFNVSNTSVQISSIPLQMNNQKIQFLATPVDVGDATRKDYVDNLITPLQAKTQNLIATPTTNDILHSVINTLEFGESFKIQDDTLSPLIEINNTDINYYRNQNLNATQIINAGPIESTSFTKIGGSSFDFLKADGSVSQPEGIVEKRLNNLYYDVNTGKTTFSINMDSWRYMSWGYVGPTTVSVVDCVTTLMTHQGGSLGILGINAGIPAKGYKIRVGSNVPSTANGATCGWLGAAVQNFIVPRGGWYIKIGFSLDSTAGGMNNRTMIGLFQSNTRPVLDNTTTIASVVTGSMGIVQEKGETVFSFNTRGPSGSTKLPTTISCETPNNNWYTLEMINEPGFSRVTLILTSQTNVDTQTATTSFICGQANTMALATAWVHLQQSMASPGGINNSASLALGNITMKMAQ